MNYMAEVFSSPVNYTNIRDNFRKELYRATQGQRSSIPYLIYITKVKPIVSTGIVQGIVIGGTNYIVSTQRIEANGTKTTLHHETGTLPIITNEEVLRNFLLHHRDQRAEAVGINLGFPIKPITGLHGEIDGQILNGTKEHTFTGLIDKPLGDFVREVYEKDIPVAVANDTICLTLAGDGEENGSLIAGTGFNVGLKQIVNKKPIIINLEAGNFNKFEATEILKTIDASSEMPGKQLFEKIISGKYLATYFNAKAASLGIRHKAVKTSQELSALSHETSDARANKLARALLERSAGLVAAAIAGLYAFSIDQKIIALDETFTLVSEGSLLWKGWRYYDNVQEQLELLGIPKGTVELKHVKDSSIKGAIGLVTK